MRPRLAFKETVERHALPAADDLTLAITLAPDQIAVLARRLADLIARDHDDGFLDVDGAAAYLGGCSRKAVYHLVERGRIRSHRVGGRLLFDPAELRADAERGE